MPVVIMFCGLSTAVNPALAQTWTQTSAPNEYRLSIASSADGSKLVALGFAPIYASTNSGATWIQITDPAGPVDSLFFVTMSSDGNKLAATTAGGFIYTSTNFGLTWVSNSVPTLNLISIASSADGDKLVVVTGVKTRFSLMPETNGPIYVSTNSGTTWTMSGAPTNYWSCVASSADGTKLAAGTLGATYQDYYWYRGLIYVSTNSGTTWTRTSAPTNAWACIASSADGTKLAAVASGASIYTSADSGATWRSNNVPDGDWIAVASSADGSKLVAEVLDGPIYTSTDSGVTWVSNNVPPTSWSAVASSADGSRLTAAAGLFSSGPIFVSDSAPAPQVSIASKNGKLTLSWIVPSTNFVLQQSPDLSSWTDVTDTPALNLTYLQDEVTLTPINSSGFYRLMAQ